MLNSGHTFNLGVLGKTNKNKNKTTMKKILITLFCCGCMYSGFGQTLQPDIIAASGGSGSNGNVNINWTIGQPLATKMTNGVVTLTSGFQQGNLKITTIEELQDISWLTVFPNPIQSKLIIKTDLNIQNLKLDVLSLDGKFITTTAITTDEQTLDLSNLKAGVYFIKIYTEKELIKTYQIIKQ